MNAVGTIEKLNKIPTEIKTGKLEQACMRYGVGKNTMRRIAKEANAVVRIGKCYLINFTIVDKYMDNMSDQ